MRFLSSLVILALCCSTLPALDSWPEFRGPVQDGHADAAIPLEWSESKNVVWKTPIHGRAWSTPVVLGPQVWLSTATEDGTKLSAICVDRESGKVLHDRVLFEVAKPRPLGNSVNCYGSPSPVIDASRVYIGFGSYGIAAIDTTTFKTVWERRDLECNHFRGPASSLVLYRDSVVTNMDGSDHQFVIALDTRNGETRWRRERSTDYGDLDDSGKPRADGDYRKAFNTPLVVSLDGRDAIISPGAKAAFAYDAKSGKEIWTLRYGNHSTASRTVFGDGVAFINTGYPKAQLWAVRADGSGDITDTKVLWKCVKSVPNRSSPVFVDGKIFMVSDRGIASCLDATTGEFHWQERIGGTYSASALANRGRIYFSSEQGDTTVIAAKPDFKILAKSSLDDGFMASPAVAGKALYLRTKSHLYRVELR